MSFKSFISNLLSGKTESKPPASAFGPDASRAAEELKKKKEWDRALAEEQGRRGF